MSKTGGVPAHPIVLAEASVSRPRAKGDAAKEDTAAGFGFPQHLESLDGAKGDTSAPADRETPKLKGWASPLGWRPAALQGKTEADVTDGEGDMPLLDDVKEGVARDLTRMLESDSPSAESEENTTIAKPADEDRLKPMLAALELIQGAPSSAAVAAVISSQGAAVGRAASTPAADPGPRATPITSAMRQMSALSIDAETADPAELPSDDGEVLAIPGAVSPREGGSEPTDEIRRLTGAVARDVGSSRGGRNDGGVADVKVTTLRQETHFAPVMRTSPTLQIVDAVASTLSGSDIDQPITNAADLAQITRPQASSSALRVLQVQLQPIELGTVTISLSLKADVLQLHIEAARAATADMLRADREALSGLLRSVGYDVDSMNVQITEADAGSVAGPQLATLQSSSNVATPAGQTASGWSMPEEGSRGARSQGGQEQRQSSGSQTPATEGGTSDDRSTSGVYL
jgi:chemotaxis protein MotD